MTHLIHTFDEADDLTRIGGKAAALARLVRAGFDVPAFFVIPPDNFHEDGLRKDALAALERQLAQTGPGPFAVRSSAREEDGAEHSHAGQFLSLLNIEEREVADAAHKVWRSGFASSLQDYRAHKGLTPKGGAPAVLVQQMVAARCAGVAFTADPVSGRRDRLVLSAIAGLADQLVGGEVDGSDYTLDGRTSEVLAQSGEALLSPDDLAALFEACRKVEAEFGVAQDIEWAFDEEGLKLLQARPITSNLHPLSLPDDHLTIFDNSNIVESYPGLVTPLTYSFAQTAYARVYRMFVAIVGVRPEVIRDNAVVFDNMLARLDGRVYYNLVNWYKALALLPGFALNRAHMETMMGVSEALPETLVNEIAPPRPRGFKLVREWAKMARVGGNLALEGWRLKRTIKGFEKRLDDALERPVEDLKTMPLSQLAREYRRIEASLLDRWDAPLINDFLCMMAFGASRKLLEKWGGGKGLEAHNDIMIGQGDIISAEPARRIRHMGQLAASDPRLVEQFASGDDHGLDPASELAREIEAYIDKFGDRCTEELKLESITLDEDRTPLLMSIAAASASHSLRKDQSSARDPLGDLFAGKPVRRVLARMMVGWARKRVRDRENLRFERTRIFGRARKLFLAIGAQFHALDLLDTPRDVFYLTLDEILGAIEGYGVSHDLKSLAALRRQEMMDAQKRSDPDERLPIRGAVVAGLETALDRAETSDKAEPDQTETQRRGTGCSAGVVRARAKVVRDPRTQHLARGDILVARHTDPGWIALFSNASAIVVERGSLLSHSAIVAREMGIPCVVGLKGAMDWIEDGALIEVDGALGRVTKIND